MRGAGRPWGTHTGGFLQRGGVVPVVGSRYRFGRARFCSPAGGCGGTAEDRGAGGDIVTAAAAEGVNLGRLE